MSKKIWKTEQPECWIYFGKRIVEISGIFKGAYILDVGSGRGTSLLPAAKKTGPEGLAIGVDNWDPFVKGTTQEIHQKGLTNAFMIKMDAKTLGFKEGSFDFVLSGFSYIFCSLKDIYAMLKNDGRVTLSAWQWQDDLEWMGEMVQKIVPENEYEDLSDMGVPSENGRPWVYCRDSVEILRNLLSNSGFNDIKILTEKKEILYRDEEEWWSIVSNSGWQSYLRKIENMGSEVMSKFKDDTFEMLQKYKDEKGVHFSRTVLLATAVK